MSCEHTNLLARDLVQGDQVIIDDTPVRVVRGPDTVHVGASPFDEFQWLVGVLVESLEIADRRCYVRLEPSAHLARIGSDGGSA